MTGRDKTSLATAKAQIKRLTALLEHDGNNRGEFGREMRSSIARWRRTVSEIEGRYGQVRRK